MLREPHYPRYSNPSEILDLAPLTASLTSNPRTFTNSDERPLIKIALTQGLEKDLNRSGVVKSNSKDFYASADDLGSERDTY